MVPAKCYCNNCVIVYCADQLLAFEDLTQQVTMALASGNFTVLYHMATGKKLSLQTFT